VPDRCARSRLQRPPRPPSNRAKDRQGCALAEPEDRRVQPAGLHTRAPTGVTPESPPDLCLATRVFRSNRSFGERTRHPSSPASVLPGRPPWRRLQVGTSPPTVSESAPAPCHRIACERRQHRWCAEIIGRTFWHIIVRPLGRPAADPVEGGNHGGGCRRWRLDGGRSCALAQKTDLSQSWTLIAESVATAQVSAPSPGAY